MPVYAPGDLVEHNGEVFLVLFRCPNIYGQALTYLRPVVEDPAGQAYHFTYPRATRVYGWKAVGSVFGVALDDGLYVKVGVVDTRPG